MTELQISAFHVRFSEDGERRGLVVEAASFEAAAVAFLEREAPADGGDAVLIVCEAETGHEHCFRIDLAMGVTTPC